MSTQSVPGADPKNLDKLDVGCWAEDKKGTSLLHVIGHEVFQIYDLNERPPLFYQDAMLEAEFKSYFSTPPVGKSKTKWKRHDKTTFPWDRVMKRLSGKVPVHADVQDHMSVGETDRRNPKGCRVMTETFDDPTYELGAECEDSRTRTVWQYIYSTCHPDAPTRSRFEGVRGELPIKLRIECTQCGNHMVTLPLARDGREALVLGKPREE